MNNTTPLTLIIDGFPMQLGFNAWTDVKGGLRAFQLARRRAPPYLTAP